MHPDSICTRDNPKKTTKKGRTLLAFSTRARVRVSSNMGPTFNATDTRKRCMSVNATHAFPSHPLTHYPYANSPARRVRLVKRQVRPGDAHERGRDASHRSFQIIDWK